MGRYIVIYEPGQNTEPEHIVIEGENLLLGVINAVGQHEGNYFEAVETMYKDEKLDINNLEIGMLEFYEMFVNDRDWPIPIMVLDITDPMKIESMTIDQIQEVWDSRPIPNQSEVEGPDVDTDSGRELS